MKNKRFKYIAAGVTLTAAAGCLLLYLTPLRQNKASKNQPPPRTNQSAAADQNTSLVNGTVVFKSPAGWLVQAYKDCNESTVSNSAGCIDARALVPPEKLETVFFNDLENDIFAVFIKVFPSDDQSSEAWFTKTYNEPEIETQRHDANTLTINGYKVYVYKSSMIKPSYDRNGYDDINYVFQAKDKFVVVTARLEEYGYTHGQLFPGNHAVFRKYLSQIEAIAHSVHIN